MGLANASAMRFISENVHFPFSNVSMEVSKMKAPPSPSFLTYLVCMRAGMCVFGTWQYKQQLHELGIDVCLNRRVAHLPRS